MHLCRTQASPTNIQGSFFLENKSRVERIFGTEISPRITNYTPFIPFVLRKNDERTIIVSINDNADTVNLKEEYQKKIVRYIDYVSRIKSNFSNSRLMDISIKFEKERKQADEILRIKEMEYFTFCTSQTKRRKIERSSEILRKR